MQIQIEILTKKDCGLCDDAKEIVERVLPDFPATLKMIDIESNSDLFEKEIKSHQIILNQNCL